MLKETFKIDVFDPFEDPKQQRVAELHKAKAEHDYDTVEDICRDFVRKDLCMVDRADFVIAYMPANVKTTGTVHEIINSYDAQKPTMIVCPDGKVDVALWFWGFIPHKYFFGSWEELYNYLCEVGAGYHQDDDRWAYVYGLI
jgi:hypothetical protein